MKKLILFLALFISVIADGQVVVPKSTTTFSNIVATGNLRVNGTSTLTGILNTSTISSTSNIQLNPSTGVLFTIGGGNRGYWTSSGLRIGSSSSPSATLDVTGTMSVSSTATLSSTLKLGSSAVLTGGNTGTVAVLSDAVFPVNFISGSSNPADATTYYFGISGYQLTATATNSITLPYNCTLVGWDLNAVLSGATGTAEIATLSINGTTNYTLTSSLTYSTAYTNLSATGLSQNFNAGDRINIKLVCPTWATNPTAIFQGVTLWFVRRQ